jgi:hypothetical protein
MIAMPVAVNRPQGRKCAGRAAGVYPKAGSDDSRVNPVFTKGPSSTEQTVSPRDDLFWEGNCPMSRDIHAALPADAVETPKRKDRSGIETFLLVSAALLAVVCFSLASVLFALV